MVDTTREKSPQSASPSPNGTHPKPAEQQDKVAALQEFADARSSTQPPPPPPKPDHRLRLVLILGAVAVGVAVGAYFLIPVIVTAMNTVSTDDAYVNGHVTFVAPRVSGQVIKVLVDDNVRVKKGALLAQLDKEPYVVQVRIRKAAVEVATTDLTPSSKYATRWPPCMLMWHPTRAKRRPGRWHRPTLRVERNWLPRVGSAKKTSTNGAATLKSRKRMSSRRSS